MLKIAQTEQRKAEGLRLGVRCLGLLVAMGVHTAAGPLISNVNTDKAIYAPGSILSLYVDLLNSTGASFRGSVQVRISHLGATVTNLAPQNFMLNAGASTTKTFVWLPPATDFKGYWVGIEVRDLGGTIVDASSSAVDVSSDWSRFPRYGYVAHYDAGLDAHGIMWELKNYHLNGIQFYDWQWKHHVPYNAGASWPDVANRTISRSTVQALIAAAHDYGMVAMNYNVFGAAYADYRTDGSGAALSMGVFKGPKPPGGYTQSDQHSHNLPGGWATPAIYLMNNRDVAWQTYIYNREQAVFNNFAFDGWHIDSLGQQMVYDHGGNAFNLLDHHPQFINNARAALGKRMLFNTVDAGGEDQVARSAEVDFIYSELWSGNENYLDLKNRVDNVRRFGSKAVVFPAYMNYNQTSGFFNEAGIRLANAAIFACGASHLELGDGSEMLRTEYFPENTVKMSTSLKAVLRTYYDFLVGYQNLLRDDTVSAQLPAAINGVATSTNGSAGAIWLISRKTPGYNVLHLVNLLNNTSTQWRDADGTYPAPPTFSNLAVRMYHSGPLGNGRLWWASPDINKGAAAELSYNESSDVAGPYVEFTLPELHYWDMIWLEMEGNRSATAKVEAEAYDSMAGIGTESTSDAGGGLNVGFVENTQGDSYLAFHNLDFGVGATSFSARVASAVAGSKIEVRLGSPSGTLLATVNVGNTGGWQSWQTVTVPVSGVSGVQTVYVVFRDAASNLNWFRFGVPLPAPWTDADVGSVGLPGSAGYSGGTFTVTGSGADIEGTADAFQFVYQSVSPDVELRARVVDLDNTDPWAKAGVMIRQNSAANAINAAVLVTPGNGVAMQGRVSTGGGTTSTVIPGVTAPCWVRLVRAGSTEVRGSYSLDGTNWTQVGSPLSLPLTTHALAGMAITAHNNAALNEGVFDHVSVNHPPAMGSVSNRTVMAGATIDLFQSVSDVDVPAQTLRFALLSPPVGASIDLETGAFHWRPAIDQSPSTQSVTVAVSDDGIPSMGSTQSFVVTVLRPSEPTLDGPVWTNGQFGFWIQGDVGPDYTVLASTNLMTWDAMSLSNPPVLPFFWADGDPRTVPAQFYRVQLGP